MNFFFHDNEDAEVMSEINVTPLVDVMLVLLIVFMITMPVLTYTIAINLPSTRTTRIEAAESTPPQPLRLTIAADGAYFLNDKSLTKEQFEQLALAKVAENADVVLAIAADKKADYDYVAGALAIAQKSGIKKIGFVTERN